jgi:SET domain-containing protein
VLLVPVVVGKSAIHGLGAFALETIPRGTTVWRFTPGFDLDLDPDLLEAQPAHFRRVLLHYGYIDRRLRRFILCCDDARFINHSDTPNLGSEVAGDRYGVDVAVRDIAAGEELTIDYERIDGFRPAAP